ncbi:hypothetical protein N6H18_15070 [Reichenbachiella agarivorans]|uniref:Uncharacterized protein n=1 Tax=Reichenbachiella agarivorans TaxID=2979464 RepID=A0ABY6CMR3_9BACT|nr:hypothetical protein [Reichenbachiella agarivorans]UXP31669.1 hypothetical protein N6H18_15070 [Reichenbachiella agarivorans]
MKLTSEDTKDEQYNEVIKNSRQTTQNIYQELVRYDSVLTTIETKIDSELRHEKRLLGQKKDILIELQEDFDSIYLTPHQLSILATATIDSPDNISFREWITSTNQLYNIGVSLFISFFFYYLGRRQGEKQSQ